MFARGFELECVGMVLEREYRQLLGRRWLGLFRLHGSISLRDPENRRVACIMVRPSKQ